MSYLLLCVGGMRATLLLCGSPPQSGDAAADSGERQYCMHVTEQQNHLYPMSYVHALHNVSFFEIYNVTIIFNQMSLYFEKK